MDNIQYLITGVEDGWIKVNNDIWRLYLIAKELVRHVNKRSH